VGAGSPLIDSRSPNAAAAAGFDVRSRVARASRVVREDRQRRQAGRRDQRIGLRRLLGWAAFLPLASRAPVYGRLFWELVRDERTPSGRKALLAAALGYLVVFGSVVMFALYVYTADAAGDGDVVGLRRGGRELQRGAALDGEGGSHRRLGSGEARRGGEDGEDEAAH